MGPGHKDYVLPIVKRKIEEAHIIIGGRRNIESIIDWTDGKKIYYIDKYLENLVNFIKKNRNKNIAIIVSGDTGFYSLLTFLQKNFAEELNVIPGISSIQYMFAKISDTWNDAYISSVHGRELDLSALFDEYNKIGLLTDNKYTPQKIAETVFAQNEYTNEFEIYVGENLSYENEKIIKYKAQDLMKIEVKFDINVVIIKRGIRD